MSKRKDRLKGLHPTRVPSPFPLLPVRRATPGAPCMNGYVEGAPCHEQQYAEGSVRGWTQADNAMLRAAHSGGGGLNNNGPRPVSGSYDGVAARVARRRSQQWPDSEPQPGW
ncbi:uncharacterized protein LOC119098451 [Pollicipes pollicipes]|uniref:uncharacterized protein LOC119098451 n=1 Tax=Pollicipes pollicipes TaxID=41117 RepID=UPI001884F318|nr:uncharacterized protein LOC119098451 [Pollicipes pollicipes]